MPRTSQEIISGTRGFAVFGRCIRLLAECGRFLVVTRFVVVVVMVAAPALTVALISATVAIRDRLRDGSESRTA